MKVQGMRRAFTLMELLVVIGIMGLLGGASVGGYRAMQRGMAEKGVMENVNHFIHAAYQRAQVDRQPTAVYFWNETKRVADDYSGEIVVGRAVAIRRAGRLTRKDGQLLYDEFADLERSYTKDDAADDPDAIAEGSGNVEGNTMYLYPIDDLSAVGQNAGSDLKRSIVYQKVFGNQEKRLNTLYLSGNDAGELPDTDGGYFERGDLNKGEIKSYAFKLSSKDTGAVSWEPGMAYGFEFAELTLPYGFVFGTTYSKSANNPVQPQGTLVFSVGDCTGSGVNGDGGIENNNGQIQVSELLPNTSGELAATPIGTSLKPTDEILK